MADDDTGLSNESMKGISKQRRRLLAAMGGGVAAGLAGCSGDGDTTTAGGGEDTPADTETEPQDTEPDDTSGGDTDTETEQEGLPETDRTYQTYFGAELAELNWDVYTHRTNWPRFVSRFAFAFKGSLDQDTGEVIPMVVQDWSVSAEEIQLQLRDDAYWYKGIPSEDGEDGIQRPILASDLGMARSIDRWGGPGVETMRERDQELPPNGMWEAITDITWDDDAGTVTLHSEPGWFSEFYQEPFVNGLMTAPSNTNLGDNFTTKADVFLQDKYEELNSIGNWEERREVANNWEPQSTMDPVEVPTSGPFTITDVSETTVTMEKNPGYYNADRINFPTVELENLLNENQRNQALSRGRLDGINGSVFIPQANILEQLDDKYEWWLHDQSGTSGFSLNSKQIKWFKDPRVRQAVYLALNKEQIARQGHRFANTAPQQPPGLIAPSYRRWVPEEDYDGYSIYKRDLDRASELMRAAGFTKDGVWKTPEGDNFGMELLATTDSVQVPAIVMQNLKEFGLEMDLVTQGSTQVDNRKGRGDFQMAIQGWWVDHIGMWTRVAGQSDRRHRFGEFITDETAQAFVDEYSDQGVVNKEYDWTNNIENASVDMWEYFKLPVPPVGERPLDAPPVTEWDGVAPDAWEEMPVILYAMAWWQALDDETRTEYMRKLTWAFNWFLPYLPTSISAQLAVQDHGEWNAPTDETEWMQHAPMHKLMAQGKINANPE